MEYTNDIPYGKKLLKLFLSTLYLSAFTFGGGYVIITLLKKKFVDDLHWIREEEMLDLVAIAQSSPGPIAVNGAIVLGYQIAGPAGIIFAVLGAVIPPLVILSVVSMFYDLFRENAAVQAVLKGMRAGVAAVIFSVVFDMARGILREKDPRRILIMGAAFAACYVFRVNAVLIILAAAAAGILCRRSGGSGRTGNGKEAA